jgi:hypothetical protein
MRVTPTESHIGRGPGHTFGLHLGGDPDRSCGGGTNAQTPKDPATAGPAGTQYPHRCNRIDWRYTYARGRLGAQGTFIKKFGAEKGLTAPVLESIWQARKHGCHKPYDAPFAKFRAFFNETRPLCPFRPDTIQPGDVIGFLRRMQEEGSNHGSIKDASASISTAINQATDGAINIGKKDSVIAFLKSVRIHQPVGPRRKRIPDGYGDVARLYEEAWSFGPNDALCNRHLQDKLILLLMLDTAARPCDLQHLYRVAEGAQRQILFNGKDMQIRYFHSKEEVDPGSARQNSSNTYFSSWVTIMKEFLCVRRVLPCRKILSRS